MVKTTQRRFNRVQPLALATLILTILATTKGPLYHLRVQFSSVPLQGDFIDDRLVQGAFLALYGGLAAVAWPARHRVIERATPLLVTQAVFLLVLLLSALWSIGPGRTVEQAVMLIAGTLAFALAAGHFSERQMLFGFWFAMQVGIALSLFARWQQWVLSVDARGNLVGIYFNRNSLGAVATAGVLTTLALLYVRGSDRRRPEPGVIPVSRVEIAAIGIVGILNAAVWWWSNSLTPAMALVLGIWAGGLVLTATAPGRYLATRSGIAAALGVLTLLVLIASVVARSLFVVLIGRSPTYTGRTLIWAEVVEAWSRRPIGGYGFMAAWFDSDLRAGLISRGRDVYEAHSGYLEVLLGAGIIGVLALSAILIVAVAAIALRVRARPDPIAIWFVAATTFTLSANLGETYIGANLFIWMLFIVVTIQARLSTAAKSDGTGVNGH
jgi:O-antigen ligase